MNSGLDREGPGDADPLPLPAAELVRLAVGRPRRQPDGLEQLLDPVAAAGSSAPSLCTFSTSSSVWRTVIVGLSDEYGSWKTTWIRLRSSRVSRAPAARARSARRRGCRPTSAARAGAPAARGCSSPSRSRRPAPASRRARSETDTSSTARSTSGVRPRQRLEHARRRPRSASRRAASRAARRAGSGTALTRARASWPGSRRGRAPARATRPRPRAARSPRARCRPAGCRRRRPRRR